MKSHFKSLLWLFVILNFQNNYWVFGEPQLRCFFIFGDSLADNGNNNHLLTTAKADYRPYGYDFPKGATGRFSNGRNLPDYIAKFMKFKKYIPPFKNTKGFNILHGVNYASGGAGIREETGRLLGEVIWLGQQLKNHNVIISKIDGSLGNNKSATATYLKRCLYMVVIGSNDYLANYYRPFPYTTRYRFTPQQYAIALAKQLSSQLKTLYGQGGRKVAVLGVGILGCTPYVRNSYKTKGSQCVDEINNAVQLYNIAVKSLVQDFNAKFTDAKFIFVDIYHISSLDTPNQGQIVSDAPCCEVVTVQCVPFGNVCGNRTEYIFWDGVHPTEIGFKALAERSYNAQHPNDTYPFDISHLVQLTLS